MPLLFIVPAIVIILILLLKPYRVIYLRQLFIPAICLFFILGLILLSETVLASAKSGMQRWAFVIVPSLFPFFIAAEILNATGFMKASGILLEPLMKPVFNVPGSASFALIMGIVSGYPVGAKIVSDLRSNGAITGKEAERLLAFTNNSGPLFIIGAIGTTLYGSTTIGVFLFVCHLIASITVGLLFRFYGHAGRSVPSGRKVSSGRSVPSGRTVPPRKLLREFGRELRNQASLNKPCLPVLLGEAVKKSVSSVLVIGGFVVLFSVVIRLLTNTGIITFFAERLEFLLPPPGLNGEILTGFISGLLEISTGSELICSGSCASLTVKLPATSFIIGWAGLSVHSQVISMLSKTDIKIRAYLFGKLLHGAFAALYTWAGLKMFGGIIEGTVPANNPYLAVHPTAEAIRPGLAILLKTAASSIWILLIAAFLFIILLLPWYRRHTYMKKSYGITGKLKNYN